MATISRPSVQPRHKGSKAGEVIREHVEALLARQPRAGQIGAACAWSGYTGLAAAACAFYLAFRGAVRVLLRFSCVPDLASRRTLRPATTQKRM
jgi:hypothetical protein